MDASSNVSRDPILCFVLTCKTHNQRIRLRNENGVSAEESFNDAEEGSVVIGVVRLNGGDALQLGDHHLHVLLRERNQDVSQLSFFHSRITIKRVIGMVIGHVCKRAEEDSAEIRLVFREIVRRVPKRVVGAFAQSIGCPRSARDKQKTNEGKKES